MGLMAAKSKKGAFASADAVRDAIVSLDIADQIRLKKIAQGRALGLAHADWRDLLQEAVARALSGSRRWPHHVPIVAFIAETMRSIASEWRDRASAADVQLPDGTDVTSDHPDSERVVIARDLVARIYDAVSGDPAVLSLLAGLSDGETAAETMARTGLSPLDYDAARKRFRRALNKIISTTGDA